MIKIGIELNGVIRDINHQYIKYYTKGIDPSFDDTLVNTNVVDISKDLKFHSKSEKEKFIYEDYPYEIFGCAAPMSRNLHTFLNGWAYDLYWSKGIDDIGVFSMDEDELTIQSTFFYLSKSGTRIRDIYFPRNYEDIWKKFDVVITNNPKTIKSKPSNKISILIETDDNKECILKSDYCYGNLIEIIDDSNLINEIKNNKKLGTKISFIEKIKQLFKKNGKRN